MALLFLAMVFSVQGKEAVPTSSDPVLEKRVMDLAAEVRCLVCQNQSLADSNAELATDLRNQIREQMRKGASEQDVIAFLVARYGDFVLYRPPLKGSTLLLWLGPFALLLLGIVLLVRKVRRQAVPGSALSDADRARAAELLKE